MRLPTTPPISTMPFPPAVSAGSARQEIELFAEIAERIDTQFPGANERVHFWEVAAPDHEFSHWRFDRRHTALP